MSDFRAMGGVSATLNALLETRMELPSDVSHHDAHRTIIEANSLLFRSVTRIFSEESSALSVEPARAAAALRGLLFAVNFPLNGPDEEITADEAVTILLDGVLAKVVV